MISIIISIISFVLGVLGVLTKTRHEQGKKSVTFWGWIVVVLLAAMVVVQYLNDKVSETKRDKEMTNLILRSDVPHSRFLVTVHTGDDTRKKKDAGTDRPVYARFYGANPIFGSKAISEWVRLNNPGNDFIESEASAFSVRVEKIVECPTQIELKWDDLANVEKDAGWTITKIHVRDLKLMTNANFEWSGSFSFTKDKDRKAETNLFQLTNRSATKR